MTKEYGTPGPRPIHPEIARSRSLRRVSILANALFPRILPLADDQGRGAGDAAELVAVSGILLVPDVTLGAAMEAVRALDGEDVIALYDVDGEPFWQVVNWWLWQGPGMRRAYPSRYPAPPDWTDAVYGSGEPGAPKTWREALGLPPGQPGPRRPRGDHSREAPEPSPRSAETVRTSLAKPSQAGPALAEPGPALAKKPRALTRDDAADVDRRRRRAAMVAGIRDGTIKGRTAARGMVDYDISQEEVDDRGERPAEAVS